MPPLSPERAAPSSPAGQERPDRRRPARAERRGRRGGGWFWHAGPAGRGGRGRGGAGIDAGCRPGAPRVGRPRRPARSPRASTRRTRSPASAASWCGSPRTRPAPVPWSRWRNGGRPCAGRVLDRDPQVRGGLLVGRRVRPVEAQQPHVDVGELLAAAEDAEQFLLGPGRLVLDVQAGQHQRHRVPVAAEKLIATLAVGGRRAAPGAGEPHPVRPVLAEGDRVEVRHHVRVEVARARRSRTAAGR